MEQQTTRLYTSQFRNKLKNRIKDLNNYHLYKEIYKIILKNNMKYKMNNNGLFFNINKLPDNAIEEILELIIYYHVDNKVNIQPIQYKHLIINTTKNRKI